MTDIAHRLPQPLTHVLPDGTVLRVEATAGPAADPLAAPTSSNGPWSHVRWRAVAEGVLREVVDHPDGPAVPHEGPLADQDVVPYTGIQPVLGEHFSPELAIEAAWVARVRECGFPLDPYAKKYRFWAAQAVRGLSDPTMIVWNTIAPTKEQGLAAYEARAARMEAERLPGWLMLFDRESRRCLHTTQSRLLAIDPAAEWLPADDLGPFTGSAADDTPLPVLPTAGLSSTSDGRLLAPPPSIQAHIDTLVAATHDDVVTKPRGNRIAASLATLTAWIEADEEAMAVSHEQGYGDLTALKPGLVGGHLHPSWEGDIRDSFELDDETPVTEALSMRWFEERRIPTLLESDSLSVFGPVWLTATDGRKAVIFADTLGSMMSVETTWYGPYLSVEAFRAGLHAAGWALDPHRFAELPLEEKRRLLR